MNARIWLYKGMPFQLKSPQKNLELLKKAGKENPKIRVTLLINYIAEVTIGYKEFEKYLRLVQISIIGPSTNEALLKTLFKNNFNLKVLVRYRYLTRSKIVHVFFRDIKIV